jgi:serpin B
MRPTSTTALDPPPTVPRRPHRRAGRALVALAAAAVLAAACGSAGTVSQARGEAAPIEPAPTDAEALVDPGAGLAASLLRAVAAERGGNVAVSPVLALDGLAMIRAGSGGDTRTELDGLLGTGELRDEELLASVAGLDVAIAGSTGEQRSERRQGTITVDAPSSIWLQRGTALDEGWLDLLSSRLDRPARLVDFRSDPDSARTAINQWASDETGGGIDALAPRGVVTSSSRLVLAAALWFEAPWALPFDVARTTDDAVALPDGTTATVPVMHLATETGLRYAEGDGWEAVELPYLGDDLAMVVVVPRDATLADLEARLSAELIDEIDRSLRPRGVRLSLPRFSFTTELELSGALRSMGLARTTDVEEADLEPMAPAEPLAVDEVLQQTYVSIDEEGTEQSAATVSEEATAPPDDLIPVQVDQPFLFLVVHRPSDSIVLIGHVVDPRS